ncbi:CitMHS family transporter [Altericroceibacterium endophyticum]|uniref:Citrate transporter n=1 Tax=Altericroceibacterium endophyticum TaxID=1808508 RepID=A0A6I4T660_9SPHN|nr:citrate:proton symporter [Altericroceibacterium endophyticum]MXO66327.1 citrate transporter [Altericroceibacterium endophyticum]
MLALAGLLTILAILAAILTKRLSPMVALAGIPMLALILLGDGMAIGEYASAGIITVAPMAAMFLFAIIFFGILADAGLFAPVVKAVIGASRNRPARITLGTALLTSIVHLDGSGATTFMIVIPALLPIYERARMDRRLLACVVGMAAGVGNMLPWGGPTIRAATALETPVMTLFAPLVPVYLFGFAAMLFISWWLGRRETSRIGKTEEADGFGLSLDSADQDVLPPIRWRYIVNVLTVVAVIAAMLTTWLPPAIAFLAGTIVALLVNHPDVTAQREAVEKHGPGAVMMVGILFAAGVFTGIMGGSGMLAALAEKGAGLLPEGAASSMPVIVAVLSMPLSLFFDPDSFYFSILPVLGGIAGHAGVDPLSIGRAAVLGQMTTGFPISPLTPATFLLIGLSRIELADHQRYSFFWLFLLTLLMTGAAILFGVILP